MKGGTSRLVDADGCELTAGITTWIPWRWSHSSMGSHPGPNREASHRCKLNGQSKSLLRDWETKEKLPSRNELPVEECNRCGRSCYPHCEAGS